MPYPQFLAEFLNTFGYVAVGLLVAMESSGIPVPGETMLLLAALQASTGGLSIPWVIAAAATGAIVGDNLGYWAGRRFGRGFVLRYGRWMRMDAQKLARGEAFFERHGDKTVFLGRFVAVLRAYAAFLAGVNNMRYSRFTLYNALGGILWALIFGLLGYYLGSNWPLLERIVRGLGLGGALAAVLFGAGALVVWMRRERRWIFR